MVALGIRSRLIEINAVNPSFIDLGICTERASNKACQFRVGRTSFRICEIATDVLYWSLEY